MGGFVAPGGGSVGLNSIGTAQLNLSSDVETALSAANYAAFRAAINLAVGTDVQAYDAELAALAGLASAADRLPYFTGSGTAALATFPSFGRSVAATANLAALLAILGTGTPGATNFLRGDGAWATAGKILQVVSTFSSAAQTGATPIPADDSFAQNTEGDQFFSLAITPQASNSTLLFIGSVALGTSNSSALAAAMFVDSAADAIGTWTTYVGTTGFANSLPILMSVSAGSTSPRTYKLRCGSSVGTTTLNGWGGARKFGGAYQSGFVIIEVSA